jgi:hypothetical protein
MSFSTELARLVSGQLSRLATLNRHQLAGQAANLDFWVGQARHALEALDGYGARFVRMHAAQEQHVSAHGTTEYALGVDCPTARRAAPPRRVPDRELREARQALVEAAYRFLARCRKEGLVSLAQLAAARETLGVGSDGEALPGEELRGGGPCPGTEGRSVTDTP